MASTEIYLAICEKCGAPNIRLGAPPIYCENCAMTFTNISKLAEYKNDMNEFVEVIKKYASKNKV